MTFIFKGFETESAYRHRPFMAELCPVHWTHSDWAGSLQDEHGLVAVATLVSLDGELCHIPCNLMQVTDLARKLSAENGVPMPAIECEAKARIESTVPTDWRIDYTRNERFGWSDPEDIDLAWMETTMPPPGAATVLDVDGKSRRVIVAPRLLRSVDVYHEPRRFSLYGAEALVGVLAMTYRSVWEVTGLEPPGGHYGTVHLWPVTKDIPKDLPEGVADVYAHLGEDDHEASEDRHFSYRSDVYRQVNAELAATVCWEQAGLDNEYSAIFRERGLARGDEVSERSEESQDYDER